MDKIQKMLIKMLKNNNFFKDLEEKDISKFTDLFKLEMAGKNENIIIEWHKVEYLYILTKWELIAKKASWLKSIMLWKIKEWDIFWEMSFFYKQPAMATVTCESTSADFWKISRENFDYFLKENPEIKTKIWDILAKRENENKEKLWGSNRIDEDRPSLNDIKINI